MLLNMLNKLDGGASVGLLAELSGLHRTTVRRLLETLLEEGYVRRSTSDDSFRLTIKVRQLSEGFRDEQWISALAAPLLGDLLREVVWPTDVSTLDVDAMVVRETTHRFSRLSFHRAMVGRRLPLLKTASGLTWLAFCPEQERKELIEMLASRPGDDYQLAREPLKLEAILARARKEGYGQNYRAGIRRRRSPLSPYRCAVNNGDWLSESGVYGERNDHRTGSGKASSGAATGGKTDRRRG
ncbi:DNA-binding transcriptional activator MhpR [Escherichia coli]|nr:DNA-binding transcriptional activator MhpR [Escherichia coli]